MAATLLKPKVANGGAKTLDRILSSTRRMARMVDQLLDLTRSRLAGGIPVELKPTDLGEVVRSVVAELRTANPDRQTHCRLSDAAFGFWDPDRLAQVVSNLAGNAIEHGDPSQPVEVALHADDREATLEVRDRGRSIPGALAPVLFDPYKRAARRENGNGLGLGLFITKQIVDAHGGSITFDSNEHAGTVFRILLPRRSADLGQPAATPAAPQS
jgi:signal transduction histidine kinase